MIPPQIQELLDALHQESLTQERTVDYAYANTLFADHANDASMQKIDAMMLDKFIALDQDKSLFIYNLLLAQQATVVVEAGTSFGVSTIYWSLAVGENAKRAGKKGKVIATEKEEQKAAKAREIWSRCGTLVEDNIDLRVGDLHQTLNNDLGLKEGEHVDFLLLDIWSYVALPALKLVQPKMRPGSIVVTDNSIKSAKGYADLLKVLRDPNGPWSSVTLPYTGGLELSVYNP